MLLKDIKLIAQTCLEEFNAHFDPSDCKIPLAFRERVTNLKGFTLVYNDYSIIVRGRVNGDSVSRDSYLPNQAFFMASYFSEYLTELFRYKEKAVSILKAAGYSSLANMQPFFTNEKEHGKEHIENGNDPFIAMLDEQGYIDGDRDLLIKFVTDYQYWNGEKYINRNDFFQSPLLNLMGLTASSNSMIANIVEYLATHPEDYQLLRNEVLTIRQIREHMGTNKIFFGTPGGGKSHMVTKLLERVPSTRQFRTTFHPDSDYASFVGTYKPKMAKDANGNETLDIIYSFEAQVFTKAYIAAWKDLDNDYYLIIEEINRGNCAQIFGDLFQLLDRKNGVSEYPIDADSSLEEYLLKKMPEQADACHKLCLPSNLHIYATMNTSDQSLLPMDSAFKRRWEWEYVPIKFEDDDPARNYTITIGKKTYLWREFLKVANKKIKDATDSEDKQMGGHFIKSNVDEKQFKSKVMYYLWSEVFKVEYGTPKNHFQYYPAGNEEPVEFTFNQLYEDETEEHEAPTNILNSFISKYLGVNEYTAPATINPVVDENPT